MLEGYFSPWQGAPSRDCQTCRHAIGTPDGHHLWCERHRLVVVFPCGWWERKAVSDDAAPDVVCRPTRHELERSRVNERKVDEGESPQPRSPLHAGARMRGAGLRGSGATEGRAEAPWRWGVAILAQELRR